jgi:hypothetical protein
MLARKVASLRLVILLFTSFLQLNIFHVPFVSSHLDGTSVCVCATAWQIKPVFRHLRR